MRGLLVTGTDTGAGKTVVAGAICAALAARGLRVAAFKPVVTGLEESVDEWPHDHELLAATASAGQSPEEVAPRRFGPPVSPHYAAELAGERLDPAALAAAARQAARSADALVCEGVGGLLVPIAPDFLVRDFAAELGLPLVVAARPALGTINHTLLTLEAARACGLEVAGVVMTPWPERPAGMLVSNRETVERLGGVEVATLPATTPSGLARAGSQLPLERWLGGGD
ncbi:MAG: dethiobiotin synthase [Thermoleophilaceae bacterium]|nr:dethiobiotin synthase [Thermoleophilaceae bacterium]